MIRRLLLIVLFSTSSAFAQCVAPHALTGQPVPVAEQPVSMLGFRAYSTYLPDGYPVIYYGPGYFALPPLMREFVSIHECAHLTEPTTNEFLANCRALQVMRQQGLTQQDENFIAVSHYNDGPLPPQYGGSGVVFWNNTLACAGPRVP